MVFNREQTRLTWRHRANWWLHLRRTSDCQWRLRYLFCVCLPECFSLQWHFDMMSLAPRQPLSWVTLYMRFIYKNKNILWCVDESSSYNVRLIIRLLPCCTVVCPRPICGWLLNVLIQVTFSCRRILLFITTEHGYEASALLWTCGQVSDGRSIAFNRHLQSLV